MLKINNTKNVFLSIPWSFQEMNIIKTGLLDGLLARDYRIVLIIHRPSQRYFYRFFISREQKKIKVVMARRNPAILSLAQYLLNIKEKKTNISLAGKKWKETINKFIAPFLWFIPGSLIRALLDYARSNDWLFVKYSPDLLIASNPGQTNYERDLILSAKKFKVPTMAIDPFWDTLEGGKVPIVDRLFVWNKHMEKQAIEYQNYPPENVRVSGALRFDLCKNNKFILSREAFFGKHKINPSKKIVLFAVKAAGSQLFKKLINCILSAASRGGIGKDIQLFVRFAPASKAEEYLDLLANPEVRITKSIAHDLGRPVTDEDVTELASLLKHSSLLINAISTISLEACCFDLPIISLDFDNLISKNKKECFMPLFQQDGTIIVKNENELIKAINDYLENPGLKAEGRERILKELCHGADGGAARRVLEEAENLLARASNL